MTRIRAALVALALVAASLLGMTAGAGSASATYAGRDGRIAFVRANQIYTMSSTGTGVTRLTSRGLWSAHGLARAFFPVFIRSMRKAEVQVVADARRALEAHEDRTAA